MKELLSHLPEWQLVDLSTSIRQILSILTKQVIHHGNRDDASTQLMSDTITNLTLLRNTIRHMLAAEYVQCVRDQCLAGQKTAWSRLVHECDDDKYRARLYCDEVRASKPKSEPKGFLE